MGHNIDNSSFRQCRNPYGSSHVVSEDKESCTIWNESGAVKSNTIADCSHSMLSNTKSNIALFWGILLEISKTFQQGHVRRGKIRTATNQTRENVSKGI